MLKQVQHYNVLVVTICRCYENTITCMDEPYTPFIPAQAGIYADQSLSFLLPQ